MNQNYHPDICRCHKCKPKSRFESNPRDYALKLVELGAVSAEHLLLCALKWMSHDDVREMLEVNELSPMRLQESDSDLQDE